jgi:hypothetical protein
MLTPTTWNQVDDGPLHVAQPQMDWRDFTALMDALHYLNRADVVDAGIVEDRSTEWLSFRFRPVSAFLDMPDERKQKLFDLLVLRAAS